ncbi:unnamed protein product [Haemonchus placei]|uniref:Uncharacterized protein n=1 Tax=Haemonchus placei TaxID=6290 RepID=A0A0N4X634_HAEPC|nr:unnamed protein product [Haemonchus placei]
MEREEPSRGAIDGDERDNAVIGPGDVNEPGLTMGRLKKNQRPTDEMLEEALRMSSRESQELNEEIGEGRRSICLFKGKFNS